MDAKQLMFIKRYQRDFKDNFGVPLVVDFPAMLGEEEVKKEYTTQIDVMKEFLDETCEKYGIVLDDVIEKYTGTIGKRDMVQRVRNVLSEFSKFVVKNKFNYMEAAKLIHRDRSLIYHYYEQ
jgi:hypothetical protein